MGDIIREKESAYHVRGESDDLVQGGSLSTNKSKRKLSEFEEFVQQERAFLKKLDGELKQGIENVVGVTEKLARLKAVEKRIESERKEIDDQLARYAAMLDHLNAEREEQKSRMQSSFLDGLLDGIL